MPHVRVVVRCRPCATGSQSATPSLTEYGDELDEGDALRSLDAASTSTPWTIATSPQTAPSASSSASSTAACGTQLRLVQSNHNNDSSTPTVRQQQRPSSSSSLSAGTSVVNEKSFLFDCVLGGKVSQCAMFQREVLPLVERAFPREFLTTRATPHQQNEGAAAEAEPMSDDSDRLPLNVVIFAYGQTGSGKTHTMDGPMDQKTLANKKTYPRAHPPAGSEAPLSGTTPTAVASSAAESGGGLRSDEEEEKVAGSCASSFCSAVDNVDGLQSDAEGVPAAASSQQRPGNGGKQRLNQTNEGRRRERKEEGEDDDDETQEEDEDDAQQPEEGMAPRTLRYIFQQWETARVAQQQWLHHTRQQQQQRPNPQEQEDGMATTTVEGEETKTSTESARTTPQPPSWSLREVSISFVEIYNEQLRDLLDGATAATAPKGARSQDPKGLLRIRRAASDGFTSSSQLPARFEVENLRHISCLTVEEALSCYHAGVRRKLFRGHAVNAHSSRSHSICTVRLTFRGHRPSFQEQGGASSSPPAAAAAVLDDSDVSTIVSEIALVDLAGSERLSTILPTGTTTTTTHSRGRDDAALRGESISINKSLLTLGKVIMALSTGGERKPSAQVVVGPTNPRPSSSGGATAAAFSKPGALSPRNPSSGARRQSTGSSTQAARLAPAPAAAATTLVRTPFRDSKLTMILNHALGGNALTLMVACIHTDPRFVQESVATLFYASRAKHIKNHVRAVEDVKSRRIRVLLEEIQMLKGDLSAANATIRSLRSVVAASTGSQPAAVVTSAAPPRPLTLTRGLSETDGEVANPAAAAAPVVGVRSYSDLSTASLSSSVPDDAQVHPSSSLSPPPPRIAAAPRDERRHPQLGSTTTTEHVSLIDNAGGSTSCSGTIAETLAENLTIVCQKLRSVLAANERLRKSLDESQQAVRAVVEDRDALDEKCLRLEEKLDLYDALLLAQVRVNHEIDARGAQKAGGRLTTVAFPSPPYGVASQPLTQPQQSQPPKKILPPSSNKKTKKTLSDEAINQILRTQLQKREKTATSLRTARHRASSTSAATTVGLVGPPEVEQPTTSTRITTNESPVGSSAVRTSSSAQQQRRLQDAPPPGGHATTARAPRPPSAPLLDSAQKRNSVKLGLPSHLF